MEWKFIKNLKDEKTIKEFESIINKKLPQDYISFIKLFNGGRPSKKVFKTTSGKEHMLKSFLSFNHEDVENIFSVNKWLSKDLKNNYFAIASDPAGNYIVYNSKFELYFWNHENDTIDFITDSLEKFIEILYI